MTLRYPAHRVNSIEKYVAELITSAAAAAIIPLTDRTLVRLAFSGAGTIDLEAGTEDGLYRILIAETVAGTTSLINSATVALSASWQPVAAGEVLAVIWNATIGKWCESYRSPLASGSSVATDVVVYVKNADPALLSATVNKGTVVYISGSTGNNPYFNISDYTTDATSAFTLGILETTLVHNAFGNVVTLGIMTSMNTSGMADGAQLYLGATGAYTTVKPTQPLHEVRLGYVIKGGSVGGGIIFIRVQNGYELEELHDVLATGITKGDILVRNGSNLWVNVPVGTDTHVLTADSTTATGVKWAAGGGGGLSEPEVMARAAWRMW